MKTPLFNQQERRIMRESNSGFRQRREFYLAKKSFMREVERSLDPILAPTVKMLDRLISKYNKQ